MNLHGSDFQLCGGTSTAGFSSLQSRLLSPGEPCRHLRFRVTLYVREGRRPEDGGNGSGPHFPSWTDSLGLPVGLAPLVAACRERLDPPATLGPRVASQPPMPTIERRTAAPTRMAGSFPGPGRAHLCPRFPITSSSASRSLPTS